MRKNTSAVNKRQRKKRITKAKRYIENYLRNSLKPFIGTLITPEVKENMGVFVASVMMPALPRTVISATILLEPTILKPPFRQWCGPEADALVHHVGERYDVMSGLGPWHRFCDLVNVDENHVFQTPLMVNCIRCLAVEGRHFNAQDNLNQVP